MTSKQERYEELRHKIDVLEQDCTDEELTEKVQLYYELHPNDRFVQAVLDGLTPQQAFGADTSKYTG